MPYRHPKIARSIPFVSNKVRLALGLFWYCFTFNAYFLFSRPCPNLNLSDYKFTQVFWSEARFPSMPAKARLWSALPNWPKLFAWMSWKEAGEEWRWLRFAANWEVWRLCLAQRSRHSVHIETWRESKWSRYLYKCPRLRRTLRKTASKHPHPQDSRTSFLRWHCPMCFSWFMFDFVGPSSHISLCMHPPVNFVYLYHIWFMIVSRRYL